MTPLFRLFFFLIITSASILSQTKTDTVQAREQNRDGKRKISSNVNRMIFEAAPLINDNFTIPLNLKIYQKAILNGYKAEQNFSAEDLSSGLSREDLSVFNQNRLKTKKMLAAIYGEDIINIPAILEALGITREQIIAVAAILKFFLM